MIYFAFVYPQVLYGIEVYANTCRSYLKKLAVLNNELMQIVQHRHIKIRVANLYKSFHTLPVSVLHYYQLLLFVHKCLYCSHMMPNIFNGYMLVVARSIFASLGRTINFMCTAPAQHMDSGVLDSRLVSCGIICLLNSLT
jgi:hypothetical protein